MQLSKRRLRPWLGLPFATEEEASHAPTQPLGLIQHLDRDTPRLALPAIETQRQCQTRRTPRLLVDSPCVERIAPFPSRRLAVNYYHTQT